MTIIANIIIILLICVSVNIFITTNILSGPINNKNNKNNIILFKIVLISNCIILFGIIVLYNLLYYNII